MPRYTYTMDKNQLFVNPYNFVPADLKKTKRDDITLEQKQTLTGYFKCKMKCKTRLAIPDTARRTPVKQTEKEEHFSYPFFTVDGTHPVIPGSAIRGVIRNVYETLTDSCFGTMQKDTKITVRSGEKFEPGLLKKNGEEWVLYDAKRYLIVIDKKFFGSSEKLREYGVRCHDEQKLKRHFHSGDLVRYQLIRNEMRDPTGYTTKEKVFVGHYVNLISNKRKGIEGHICFGEKAPNRHFQSVFKEGNFLCKIQNEDISRLEAVLKAYRNKTINRKCTSGWYNDYEYAKEKGVVPVYYLKGKKGLYLSFAAVGRKAFITTLNSKAGEKAHEKCDARKNLCPACALFGTSEGEGAGSRVRFTDGKCPDFTPEQMIKNVTFDELASPKVSYLPFYLKETGSRKKYSEGYDSSELTLRGRKFYWHHVPNTTKTVKQIGRNATFDLLESGAEISFRVYFDRISEEQMNLLAAAIHLNENDIEGKYCHKLGHGKPLGYGSVKIIIEKCMIREYSQEDSAGGEMIWKEKPRSVPCSDENYKCSPDTYQALRTICDFQGVDSRKNAEVCYPEVVLAQHDKLNGSHAKKNDLANHKWFSENYKFGKELPRRVLPEILDEKVTLEKYIAEKAGE